jgi:hypothetical protein
VSHRVDSGGEGESTIIVAAHGLVEGGELVGGEGICGLVANLGDLGGRIRSVYKVARAARRRGRAHDVLPDGAQKVIKNRCRGLVLLE